MAYVEQIHDSTFDSDIFNWPSLVQSDDVNFWLTIELRVHLRQQNPPRGQAQFRVRDADDHFVDCVAWTDATWTDFVGRYTSQVNDFWNGNFVLTPPARYGDFTWPRPPAPGGVRRNVECRFRLTVPLGSNGAHVSIPVVRLADTGSIFRSHSRLYSSNDLSADQYASASQRVSWSFFTTNHEVGHLLGLDHSNESAPQCRRHPNSDICYGASLEQRTVVMGTGPMLELSGGDPWRRRIARHTRTSASDWQVGWASAEAAFRGADSIRLR